MRALAQAVRVALTFRWSRAASGVPAEGCAVGVISCDGRPIHG